MGWSLVLCPDDAKQDPAVYDAEFGVVFLAEAPRAASIWESIDYLGASEYLPQKGTVNGIVRLL